MREVSGGGLAGCLLPLWSQVLLDLGEHDIADWGGGIQPRPLVTLYATTSEGAAPDDWTPLTTVEVVIAGSGPLGQLLQAVVRCDRERIGLTESVRPDRALEERALASPTLFASSPFYRALFVSSVLQPYLDGKWAAASLVFDPATLRPVSVDVIDLGGTAVAHGTAAANALAAGWDSTRGAQSWRTYDTGPVRHQAFRVYSR